jgi:hypothetical protein
MIFSTRSFLPYATESGISFARPGHQGQPAPGRSGRPPPTILLLDACMQRRFHVLLGLVNPAHVPGFFRSAGLALGGYEVYLVVIIVADPVCLLKVLELVDQVWSDTDDMPVMEEVHMRVRGIDRECWTSELTRIRLGSARRKGSREALALLALLPWRGLLVLLLGQRSLLGFVLFNYSSYSSSASRLSSSRRC